MLADGKIRKERQPGPEANRKLMETVRTLDELEVLNCVKVLRNGQTLLYPTDTIWGLGCDATDREAVDKVYRLKNREEDKSFIILVHSEAMLEQYVETVPPTAYDLLRAMDNTPLTIIYPKGIHLPSNVLGNDGSIAIRLTHNKFCSDLLSAFGKPIVSTSANLSGQPAPLKLADISDIIIRDVDHVAIVQEQVGQELRPSRIIKMESSGMFTIVRE